MTSITDLRDAIATNLRTVSGLRSSAEVPDNPSPPIAVVQLQSIDYDQAFQGGMTRYRFIITVIVGRAAERNSQERLNSYASTSGSSVKEAVESDRTLGGNAYDCVLEAMTNVGAISLQGDVTYLAADFQVTVLAE
jgi:hypothetical protein